MRSQGLGPATKSTSDPKEFKAAYEALKDEAEWEAVMRGEAPKRNRSPVASEARM